MTASAQLLAAAADLWPRLTAHPFVTAVSDGSLPAAAFDRWLVEDHHFVVGFRRFLARLLDLAPDEPVRDLLADGLAALTPELALFRESAAERGLALDTEPCPTGLGYTAFVQAAPSDGFDLGLVVLYGAEKAYLDAWTSVRGRVLDSPYAAFTDNWSSPAFAEYVRRLGALLDERLGDAPGNAAERAFLRVVRFELRFWDAVHRGETW